MSPEALARFKTLYKKEFGVELSDKEAMKPAADFLNLMREIVEPIKKEANSNED